MRIWFSSLTLHPRFYFSFISAFSLLAEETSRGLMIQIGKKLK